MLSIGPSISTHAREAFELQVKVNYMHHHHHGHHHGHHHHHHDVAGNQKNILIAFFLNAGFSIVQFVGGYLTNSVAIYSDALHDLGDSIALLFAYLAEKFSQKQADKNFSFGYRRFSLLAAGVNGLILLLGSCYIIYEASLRLLNPEPIHALGVVGLAILGLSVNSYAAYRMSKNTGINSRMIMFHLFEDIMGWAAILVVSILLIFQPWYFLDSLLSILIALVIVNGVVRNLYQVLKIFLQAFPANLSQEKIKTEIMKLGQVKDVHLVQGWSVDESSYSLSLHVTVPDDLMIKEVDSIRLKIEEYLQSQHVIFTTVQFEGESCAYSD